MDELEDGLYQVTYKGICAGFVLEDGIVTLIAPILIRKFGFWKTIAVKVS